MCKTATTTSNSYENGHFDDFRAVSANFRYDTDTRKPDTDTIPILVYPKRYDTDTSIGIGNIEYHDTVSVSCPSLGITVSHRKTLV